MTLHEGNLHISYISQKGNFEVSKRLQRSRQNLEQSLGPKQTWRAENAVRGEKYSV